MPNFSHFFRKIKLPLILLVLALGFGVLGYKILFPNEALSKLMYMTSITLSTVGYGDILNVHNSAIATYYTMFLMLIGMGIVLYSVSTITAFLIEGKLEKIFLFQSILRRLKKMKDHYIICGSGQTGIHVIREMHNTKQAFVVIENNPEFLDKLREEFKDCLVLIGDATSEEILEKANLKTAKGLVVTLSNDKDNLFLTLTARMLNPTINIVSRAIDLSLVKKLKMAGADYVVSPNFIGGMRIASEMLRPNVVTFLDKMLRGADKSIRVGEIVITSKSKLRGKTLEDANIYQELGLNILAVGEDKGSEFNYNPPPETFLREGTVLLFIGNIDQQKEIEKFAA
jgi:voltage-gated potassium channel